MVNGNVARGLLPADPFFLGSAFAILIKDEAQADAFVSKINKAIMEHNRQEAVTDDDEQYYQQRNVNYAAFGDDDDEDEEEEEEEEKDGNINTSIINSRLNK